MLSLDGVIWQHTVSLCELWDRDLIAYQGICVDKKHVYVSVVSQGGKIYMLDLLPSTRAAAGSSG